MYGGQQQGVPGVAAVSNPYAQATNNQMQFQQGGYQVPQQAAVSNPYSNQQMMPQAVQPPPPHMSVLPPAPCQTGSPYPGGQGAWQQNTPGIDQPTFPSSAQSQSMSGPPMGMPSPMPGHMPPPMSGMPMQGQMPGPPMPGMHMQAGPPMPGMHMQAGPAMPGMQAGQGYDSSLPFGGPPRY